MSAIMPIGIIEESNGNGGIMILTHPGNGEELGGAPIVIWNENQPHGATARMRGVVTEASESRAGFLVTQEEVDPNWPRHIDPRGAGNPVYLGREAGYLPDEGRLTSPGDAQLLRDLAQLSRELAEQRRGGRRDRNHGGDAGGMTPAFPGWNPRQNQEEGCRTTGRSGRTQSGRSPPGAPGSTSSGGTPAGSPGRYASNTTRGRAARGWERTGPLAGRPPPGRAGRRPGRRSC